MIVFDMLDYEEKNPEYIKSKIENSWKKIDEILHDCKINRKSYKSLIAEISDLIKYSKEEE